MNYVHFTFENAFDYKLVLEQIPKEEAMYYDCLGDIDLLQITLGYWNAPELYQNFIASICSCSYTVTLQYGLLKDI